MKRISLSRKYGRPGFFSLVLVIVLLGACGTGIHMIAKEGKPAINPKSGKAVLVIIRTTPFGGGQIIDNYLDGKMIGQTQGKVFFISEVTPGVHYLIAHADNTDTARLNFEAGRIYLLQQGIYPGFGVTTRYSPMMNDEFQRELPEAAFRVYDAANPGKDMSSQDVAEAKRDFEREVKEGSHKEILDYKGYRRIR